MDSETQGSSSEHFNLAGSPFNTKEQIKASECWGLGDCKASAVTTAAGNSRGASGVHRHSLSLEFKEPWCLRTNFQGFQRFASKEGWWLRMTGENSRCLLFKLSYMSLSCSLGATCCHYYYFQAIRQKQQLASLNPINGMAAFLPEEWKQWILIIQGGW